MSRSGRLVVLVVAAALVCAGGCTTKTGGSDVADSYDYSDDGLGGNPPPDDAAASTGKQLIVFASDDRDGSGTGRDIWRAHLTDDGKLEDLARVTSTADDDSSPSLDPTGRYVCFVRNSQIWVQDIDGPESDAQPITTGVVPKYDPTFTRDPAVAVLYTENGNLRLYSYSTGLITEITNGGHDWAPSVSPDGSSIACASTRDLPDGTPAVPNIWRMDIDGTNAVPLTRVTYLSERMHGSPSWSPDGTKIAFHGMEPGTWDTQIYTMDSDDGDNMEKWTDDTDYNLEPVFDMRDRIVYCSMPQGLTGDLRALSTPGSPDDLTTDAPQEGHPAFAGRP